MSEIDLKGLNKTLTGYLPKQLHDFVIQEPDGTITMSSAAALNDSEAGATHICSTAVTRYSTSGTHRSHSGSSPQFTTIADVEQVGGESSRWQTISHLRDTGFHPIAVRKALLNAGWSKSGAGAIKDLAKDFKIAQMAKSVSAIDLDQLREDNSAVLQDMGDNDQVDAIFEHLARRGFAFEDRDKRWRKKFVDLVVEDLNTLADAETMAGFVLTQGVSYDKRSAEQLREPTTQALIDTFEDASRRARPHLCRLKGVSRSSGAPWRSWSLTRHDSTVLTAERAGPNPAVLTTLPGEEGTRNRLEKARKYRS